MDLKIREILDRQRRAFRADGFPSLAARTDRLDRLVKMLLAYEDEIVETLFADFGGRSRFATRVGDIVGGINAIRYNRDHVEEWMNPTPVPLPPAMEQAGARAEVRCQPLGVVGVVVPWNGPVLMACLAAAGVFAAGNRLMLKTPELAPGSSGLLSRMFGAFFDPTEAAVLEGGADVAAAFSRQPFDHLLFTGSSAVARLVMKAAAENLVPVTLELGGKNPVIVGRSADIAITVERLVAGKLASSGQVCVSPDYVFVPKGMGTAIADAAIAAAQRFYPSLDDNDDYTAIINNRHFDRLVGLVADTRAKGGKIIQVNEGSGRKFPFCVVLNPNDDMDVMRDEIFGPILPVLEYDSIDQAIDYIGRRGHPLSAYYFGRDQLEEAAVLTGVQAGNMVVNDVRCQLFFEQLPFGGVGASGMGRYRGYEGFKTFSNAKTVVYQMTQDEPLAAQRPPYSDRMNANLAEHINAMKKTMV